MLKLKMFFFYNFSIGIFPIPESWDDPKFTSSSDIIRSPLILLYFYLKTLLLKLFALSLCGRMSKTVDYGNDTLLLLKFMCLVSCLCFLPMMVVGEYADLEGSSYEDYVTSFHFTYSFACMLSLSFPLTVDLIFDLLSFSKADFLAFRFVSVANIQITAVAALIAQHTEFGPTACIAFVTWSYFIDIGLVTILLHSLVPRVFTLTRIFISNTIMLVAVLLFNLNSIPTVSGDAVTVLFFITLYGSAALLLGYVTLWVLDLRQAFKASKHPSLYSWYLDLSINEQCALTLIACVGFCVAALVLYLHAFCDNSHPRNGSMVPSFLIEASRCAIAAFTYIIPSRAYRAELVKGDSELKTKTEVVRYVSHEMRSPVGTLLVSLSSLEEDLKMHRTIGDTIQIDGVLRQVHEMKWINEGAVDILDDLLLYEKIERDKLVLNLEPLVPVSDLKMILGQWRDNIELMMPENPAAFSGYRIKADLAHIKLVFKTLLGNSGLVVDYNSVAQRKILIHVDRVEASAAQPSPPRLPSFNSKVAPSSGMPFLRVTMKFPCRHLSVLPHAASFERRGRNDGTGSSFSMFIAKSILELHGVETDLFRESSLSATTYHLDFPLYAAASSDSESSHHSDVVIDTQALVKSHAVGNLEADKTKVSANQNIVTQGSDRRLSVLVVDDSAMVRRVTAKLVARLGHTTVEACDGQKAVDLVASGMHFDVILMDNQMPVMTGVEATKIIRSVLGYKGMILGVTGNALEEDLTEFLAAGVSEVVLKPLTKEIFVNKTNNDDDFVYVL